jgi:hypothetical protein
MPRVFSCGSRSRSTAVLTATWTMALALRDLTFPEMISEDQSTLHGTPILFACESTLRFKTAIARASSQNR